MGILEHHTQGAAQGVLFDVPDVNAVIGDGTGLDLIEAVDEAGDGGLAGTGGAHKGDLLAGLGIEGDIVEDDLAVIVAEDYMVEPHVAPNRHQGAVRFFPGPGAGIVAGFRQVAAAVFRGPHQRHLALIHLRLGLHDLKDPLGAGHGGEDGVHLLGDLGDGLAHLSGVLQKGRQTAQVAAADGQETAHAAGDGVVDIGEVAHGRHHGAGVSLGPGGRLAVGLVALPETLLGGRLMVEDLDDLLALDHLLDIAVHRAQRGLLLGKVPAAAAAHHFHHPQHHHQHGKGDEGQHRAQDDHHGDGAHEVQRAGDEASEAVVEGLGDSVDIVGIAAHELAVGVGVEVLQGQILHPVKEIGTDLGHRVLGHMHHDAGIAEGAGRAGDIHRPHKGQHFGKAGEITRKDIVVDEGLDEIRSAHGAGGADDQQAGHQNQMGLIAPQIAHELAQSAPQVLGLLIAVTARAAAGAPGCGLICTLFSHRCSLLPAGTGRPRGRSRRSSSALHGCPGPPHGPGPSPRSHPPHRWRSPAGR